MPNVTPSYVDLWRTGALARVSSHGPELDRPIICDEYRAAVQSALDAGLQRLDRR